MLKRWRERSAKIQVKESDLPSSIPSQTGLVFNLWYNKWSQGTSGNDRFISRFRLDPKIHAGRTLGDKQGTRFFCLYFAKGMCSLGKKCQYKHHVPEGEDILELMAQTDVLDCFGREKFAFYRDDMAGVGSFRKRNRTLYVGGISSSLGNRPLSSSQITSRLRFLFSELGEIDKLHYLESKNCAFVKFKTQCNAEFAKEVVANQTLLIPSDREWKERFHLLGLQVKWAHDDPNPRARRQDEEEKKQETLDVMARLLRESTASEAAPEIVDNGSEKIFSDEVLDKLRKRRTDGKEDGNGKRAKTQSSRINLVDYSSSASESE